jgi:hypothetical protein
MCFRNRWFSSYEAARKSRESEGGFLLPYEKHFFVCEADVIEAMGWNPMIPTGRRSDATALSHGTKTHTRDCLISEYVSCAISLAEVFEAEEGMSQRTAHLRTQTILAATAITFLAAGALMGQAGRHLPKRVEASPSPTPIPGPSPQAKTPAKAQFFLKVVSDLPQSVYLIFPFPEKMETWAVDRLKKSPFLDVTVGAPANHREAVKRAKEETEALVVWLQLEENPLGKPENAGRRPASDEVWINISIFSPVTGKQRYFGRVVLSQTSTRGVGSGSVLQACYPTVHGDDLLLLQASNEVAARIMDSLDVPVPPVCR